jgi:hypothetical protein
MDVSPKGPRSFTGARAHWVRAPSLYTHVRSKDELLTEIMVTTMDELIHGFHRAVARTCDPVERLRRAQYPPSRRLGSGIVGEIC